MMRKLLFIVFACCFSASLLAQETVPFTNAPSQASSGIVTYPVTVTGGYTLGTIDWDGFASTINSGTYGSELKCDISGPLGSTTVTLGSGTTYAPGNAFTSSTGFFDNAGDPAGAWTFDFYESYDDGGDGLPDANWDFIDFDFNAYSPPAGITAPWSEPFAATSLPTEWTLSGPESWLFSTGAAYGAAAAGDHTTGGGTNYAWVDGSGSGSNTGITLTTPLIDPTGLTNPEFTFWYFSNNTNNAGDNNTLYVEIAADGGAWTNIFTYAGDNPDWQKFALALSGYEITTSAQFRFIVDETAGTAFYNDILIDDVMVDEAPVNPIIDVAPASPFNFNYVQLGHTASQTFTVTNIGGGTATITGGSITGDAAFTITGSSLGSLPPDNVFFTVQFAPTTLGAVNATLTITDEGGTTDVLLSGEGVAVIGNDDCADAITVGPTYPETVMGTTIGAEVDCPGVLDWGAVWYEVALPYALNNISASYCGTATPPAYTGGIVYLPDCESCASFVIADLYGFDACPSPDDATLQMSWADVPGGPGVTILFPGYVADADGNGVDFTLTFDVVNAEVVVPGTNCANPLTVGSLPYTTSDNTVNYGDDYSSTDEICSNSSYLNGDDVVYAYTPAADECVNITLTNTGTWVGLFVYEGCDPFTTCVGSNTQSGGNPSLSNLSLIGGTTYYIVISTWPSPQSTAYDLEIDICPPPVPGESCTLPIVATTQGVYNAPQQPVWYEYTATGSGFLEISSLGAGVDTRLYVYSDCVGTLVDGNDDYWGYPPGESYVGIPISGGETFYILWGDNYGTDPFAFSLIESNSSTNFTGTIDSDWWNAGNWDNGIAGVNTNATIPAGLTNYPELTAYAACNSIYMESDASMLDNGFMTIIGNLSIERTIGTGQYHSFSPSVSGLTAELFKLGSSGIDVYLYSHNEANNMVADGYFEIVDINTPLPVLDGFAVYPDGSGPAQWTFVQEGGLNTGAFGVTDNMTRTGVGAFAGFNYVGNPYPSFIDWDAASGWDKTQMNGSIYIENSGVWAEYTAPGPGNNGGSNIIAPGQGFFVEVGAFATGTIAMDNDVRTNTSTPYLKSAPTNYIQLAASGNNKVDQTVIRFDENATVLFDGLLDGTKLAAGDNNYPQIYSISDRNLSYNALPETDWVQLGFHAFNDGEYTISAVDINEIPSAWLEDTFTGEFTDLTTDSYGFNYTTGEDVDRFILHFTPLGIGGINFDNINIYSSNLNVYVSVPEFTQGTIMVYNMMGQEVASQPIKDALNKISLEETGNYVVVVMNNDNVVTDKVFVK